jgi:hypothetical protein
MHSSYSNLVRIFFCGSMVFDISSYKSRVVSIVLIFHNLDTLQQFKGYINSKIECAVPVTVILRTST